MFLGSSIRRRKRRATRRHRKLRRRSLCILRIIRQEHILQEELLRQKTLRHIEACNQARDKKEKNIQRAQNRIAWRYSCILKLLTIIMMR